MAKTEIPASECNIELMFSITITVTSFNDAGRLLEHIRKLPEFDDHYEIAARTGDGDDGTEFGIDLEDQDEERLIEAHEKGADLADQHIDVDGTVFDPNLHAWNKDKKEPSKTAAGRFRKKRKGSAPAETPASVEPNQETPASDQAPDQSQASDAAHVNQDQDDGELDPEQYSNVLKSVLANINGAKSGATLNRIENHPVIEQLNERERNIALEAVRTRAAALIDNEECD